jgi:hypothetical protein
VGAFPRLTSYDLLTSTGLLADPALGFINIENGNGYSRPGYACWQDSRRAIPARSAGCNWQREGPTELQRMPEAQVSTALLAIVGSSCVTANFIVWSRLSKLGSVLSSEERCFFRSPVLYPDSDPDQLYSLHLQNVPCPANQPYCNPRPSAAACYNSRWVRIPPWYCFGCAQRPEGPC